MHGHAEAGTPEKSIYDSVTGVSTGAFNALGVAGFAKGDELKMVDFISDLWHGLSTEKIWKNWPIPIIELRWKTGVFDDSPLWSTLTDMYNSIKPLKRMWKVGTVDFNSGTFVTFNETESDENVIKATISSGSIPLVFPRVQWSELDQIDADGGTL